MSRRSGLSRVERNNRGVERVNGRRLLPHLMPTLPVPVVTTVAAKRVVTIPITEEGQQAQQVFFGTVYNYDKKTLGREYVSLRTKAGERIFCPTEVVMPWSPDIFVRGLEVECEAVPETKRDRLRTHRAVKICAFRSGMRIEAQMSFVHPTRHFGFAKTDGGDSVFVPADLIGTNPALLGGRARFACVAALTEGHSAKFAARSIVSVNPVL